MKDKQIVLVLDAIRSGAVTSAEVSELTGLPPKICSSYLSLLAQDGFVEVTGHHRFTSRGRVTNFYSVRQEA